MTRTARTTLEGAATRERIVRAAMDAFAASGYRGASLDEIAAAVGLTRQGLLHYFPSKVKLLMAVLDLGQQDDIALITGLVDEHPEWAMSDTLGVIMRNNLSRPGLAQLRTALAGEAINPDHPGHQWFVDVYRYARTSIAQWVESEQAKGRITTAMTPERLAMTIVAVIDGLQLQAQLDPQPPDVEHALADLMAVLTPT